MTQSVWGPVHPEMHELLRAHPDDVPAVVDQLSKLQDILDRVPPLLHDNPVAAFHRLYRTITESVLERLYAGGFADPAFLSRLTVEAAARYFDALRAWGGASTGCPRVWAQLFRRIASLDVVPARSAAAGLTAHVTFDLPFALVTTFDQLGTDPIDDSDQHRDYLQITAVIAGLAGGWLDHGQVLVDTMSGTLDDWWQGDTQAYARNVAWRTAQRLWVIRHDLTATGAQRSELDRVCADLSGLLLSPLGDFLR